jgi:hypothetical protein
MGFEPTISVGERPLRPAEFIQITFKDSVTTSQKALPPTTTTTGCFVLLFFLRIVGNIKT